MFYKRAKNKIKNQKNKEWNWNINNKNDQPITFQGGERKEKKKKHHRRQTAPPLLKWVAPIKRECGGVSNNMMERHFFPP